MFQVLLCLLSYFFKMPPQISIVFFLIVSFTVLPSECIDNKLSLFSNRFFSVRLAKRKNVTTPVTAPIATAKGAMIIIK